MTKGPDGKHIDGTSYEDEQTSPLVYIGVAFLLLCFMGLIYVMFFKEDTPQQANVKVVVATAETDAALSNLAVAETNTDMALEDATNSQNQADLLASNPDVPDEAAIAAQEKAAADAAEVERLQGIEDQKKADAEKKLKEEREAAENLGKSLGFTFHQGKDSSGNDISNIGGSTTARINACKNNDGCCGVNTGGWVKKLIKPPSTWNTFGGPEQPSKGMYVKNSCATNADDSRSPLITWKEIKRWDYHGAPGENISCDKYDSVPKLRAACVADPNCKGYNVNVSNGKARCIKNKLTGGRTRSGLNFYEINRHDSVPTWSGKYQYDYSGNDIGSCSANTSKSFAQMQSDCIANPDCKGFSMRGPSGSRKPWCMKKSVARGAANSTHDFYILNRNLP